MDPVAKATLGTTNVRVTRLGLGTAPLGGWPEPVTESDGLATLAAAWDLGLRYFDTAPFYGYGQSETWIGRVLRERPRDEFSVGTKVGRLLRPADDPGDTFYLGTGRSERPIWDFSADGVRRSLEESLGRTGLDRFDIVLIHDPDDHLDEALDGAYPALHDLRSQGVIGAIGAGMNFADPLVYLAERADLDCVLVAGRYTLLEQPAWERLLPLAEQKRFSVIAGGVFNSGLLTRPEPGATYDYAPADAERIKRAADLKAVCDEFEVPLMAAAIQFPLAHPAVATVAIGARSASEIRENARLLATPLPPGLWDRLRERGLLAADVPVPTA